MKRNAVSLTMAAAMLTGMLGSAPAFAADLSNLPDQVGEGTIPSSYSLAESYQVQFLTSPQLFASPLHFQAFSANNTEA